jgi:hypothetical protein
MKKCEYEKVSEVAVYWTAEAFGGNGAQTMARW